MKNLFTALIKFQSKVQPIPKDKINPFFSQNGKKALYADLSTVIDVCKPALNDSGLAVIQMMKVQDGMNLLTTILCHESGEMIESSIMLPEISDPQKLTAAITYLRRSCYLAAVGLVAEDDDDGNSVGHQPQSKQAPQQPQQTPRPATTGAPASDAQKNALKRMNIPFTDGITKAEASSLIEQANKGR